MTVIRVTCSGCGDVELEARDLQVRRCLDSEASTYVFRCPDCGMAEVRTAEDHVVEILTTAGVPCAEWRLPRELGEHHGGPAITHDDLLDFHAVLDDRGWFDAVEAMVRG